MSLKGIQVVRTFVKNSLHYDAQYLNESLVDSVRDKKNEQIAHFHSSAIEFDRGHVFQNCAAGWRLDLALPKDQCSLDLSPESFTDHSRRG